MRALVWLAGPALAASARAPVLMPSAAAAHDVCDDLEQSGPDFADGRPHWKVFEDMLRHCRNTQTQLRLESNYTDTLQFVHVGKTGGSTLDLLLQANNILNYQHHVSLSSWPDPEKVMSDRCPNRRWLVSTRDPINRTISAFNWRSPDGGGAPPDRHRWPGSYDFEMSLYKCFPKVNDFAEALNDTSNCGTIARQALGLEASGCV